MLFTDRSVWTLVHGVVLGGGALMALAAALFAMGILRTAAQHNQANVGVYAAVARGGTIRRGDPVRIE